MPLTQVKAFHFSIETVLEDKEKRYSKVVPAKYAKYEFHIYVLGTES